MLCVGRTRRKGLEAAGIATVAVYIEAFSHYAAAMHLPRTLVTAHPKGRLLEPPGVADRQREVIETALRLVDTAVTPGTIERIDGHASRALMLPRLTAHRGVTQVSFSGHRLALMLNKAISAREAWITAGKAVAAATVIRTWGSSPWPTGSRFLVSSNGETHGSVSGGCVEEDLRLRALRVLETGLPEIVSYGVSDQDAFEVGLACGGTIEVFVQPW